jgi:UDP-2-acetamido-2,6-beta-L-arabino-hexul-4-ose reductase
MRIVVTGADGFIGRNLRVRLREAGHADVRAVTRATPADELRAALADADFVFHLAGVNRPKVEAEFTVGNAGFTATVCDQLQGTGRPIPLAFASSTQAARDNPYGRSKRAAEAAILRYGEAVAAPVYVLRLTNVFGKWARPNYNSVVATFCHNIARDLPIVVHDARTELSLLYIDDAVDAFLALLDAGSRRTGVQDVGPTHATTLGEIATLLDSFARSRESLVVPHVGTGFTRALYATYLSYLPPSDFAYDLKKHADPRGVFVEVLRTRESGQFSFFTAFPGVTRGEHYHHTKTEKFLVLQGTARFGFRHIVTNERHDIVVEGTRPQVVETVPGWAHDITNIGSSEMIVMLWANETFDPARPDTVHEKVNP